MNDIIKRIYSFENLMLAWRKLENAYRRGDIWYDEICICAFKINLVSNLKNMSDSLKKGEYKMHTLRPIPYPKGGKDIETGAFKVRQSFFIDISDQLVWISVFNVIGREFDILMPSWSFGNRQYVSMWKSLSNKGESHWTIGNYRNTTKNIYRKWTQSWPLMRKRITASLKKLARLDKCDFDEIDNQVLNEEEFLNEEQSFFKLKYLEKTYFPKREGAPFDKLYWVGIDLTNFYQCVNITIVKNKIISVLNLSYGEEDDFLNLLDEITTFKVDYQDYNYEGAEKDLSSMQLSNRDLIYNGIPTGLIVGGMLANIYMLDIDDSVKRRLEYEREVIHFRYVDDHIMISTSAEKLYEWLAWYKEVLEKNNLILNVEKLAPAGIITDIATLKTPNAFKDNHTILIRNIKDYAKLDPKYPTPLMTQTIQKFSMLQGIDLTLLSNREFDIVFNELQSLLMSDISEQEIKESTRISFACTLLSRLLVGDGIDYNKVYNLRSQLLRKINRNYFNCPQDDNLEGFLKECNQLVFNDGVPMKSSPELKKKNPLLSRDTSELVLNLNKLLNEGIRTMRYKENIVCNMMMYALDKVPDKVRVWIRVFDYSVNHNPSNLPKLYEKLSSYKNETLHKLSVEYIYAQLNTLCADHIIKATSRLFLNDYVIPAEADIDKQFLQVAPKIELKGYQHFFARDSEFLFRKALSFYNLFATRLNMKCIEGIDNFFSKNIPYHSYNLDNTFWLLWVLDILNDKKNDKDFINCLLNEYVSQADIDSEYYKSFFYTYLSEVTLYSSNKMYIPQYLKGIEKLESKGLQDTIYYLPYLELLRNNLLIEDERDLNFSSAGVEYMSITEWIEYSKNIDEEYSSTVNSELLSVLIMLSIIRAIENEGERVDKVCVHPGNFYIRKTDIEKKGWNYYLDKVDEPYLDVKYLCNPKIVNSAYEYPHLLNEGFSKDLSISYGLGIIFLQLLSKQTILPWALNSPETGFEWSYVLRKVQLEGKISSYNYRIVNSCLSPRQRENIELSRLFGERYIEEDLLDSPRIFNWYDLRDELKQSIKLLRENLISVANEDHRQLIVIDLN